MKVKKHMSSDALTALCEKLKITADFACSGEAQGFVSGTRAYTVTLSFGRRRMTTPFFTRMADPTVADVLYCLCNLCVERPDTKRFLGKSFNAVSNAEYAKS
jgi:hypothetical protein